MRARLLIAGATALALGVVPVVASTGPVAAAPARVIYVATNGNDANPGTRERPLATIWHASGKARPGDTVLVRGGTYYLKGTQYIASRGTAKAPIIYRSAPGERAILDGSRTNDGNLVDIRGTYNVFQGFTVRYAKNFGIITLGAMYSKIVGNTVHGSWQSAIGIEGGKIGGDPNPWAVGMQVIGNTVYDNVRSKKLKPKADSAPSVHADFAQNVSFIGNRIYDNHQIGIELAIVRGATVAGNYLSNNALHLHLDNASDVTVRDNFMYAPKRRLDWNTGIQSANIDWKDSNPLRNLTIRNNVIVGGHFGFMYGTYGRGGGLKNVLFEQNTVYGAAGWTLLIVADPGHSGTVFRRNVFVKDGAKFDVDVPKVAGLKFERNCWSGGPAGRAAGAGDVRATALFVSPRGGSPTGYRQRAGSPCAGLGATPGVRTAGGPVASSAPKAAKKPSTRPSVRPTKRPAASPAPAAPTPAAAPAADAAASSGAPATASLAAERVARERPYGWISAAVLASLAVVAIAAAVVGRRVRAARTPVRGGRQPRR